MLLASNSRAPVLQFQAFFWGGKTSCEAQFCARTHLSSLELGWNMFLLEPQSSDKAQPHDVKLPQSSILSGALHGQLKFPKALNIRLGETKPQAPSGQNMETIAGHRIRLCCYMLEGNRKF